jgi:hypothetical protein
VNTNSRVGSIHFDTTSTLDFRFNTSFDKATVQAKLLSTTRAVNGATATHAAVNMLSNQLLSSFSGWRNVSYATVVVFVTDGAASSAALTDTAIRNFNNKFGDRVLRYALDFTTVSSDAFADSFISRIFC